MESQRFQAPVDVSVIVTNASSRSDLDATEQPTFQTERRITPSWTVSQLKSKLETMTGVPPGSQRLKLKAAGRPDQWMEGGDDDSRVVGDWGLARGCEIEVHDTRPQYARLNLHDLSSVEKYVLPQSTYESLPNSVLSWKKNQKLGRFNPNAASPSESMRIQAEKDRADVRKRGIVVSSRAIILPSTPPHIRRGTVRFVGQVPTIPYPGLDMKIQDLTADSMPTWVGIELDEPTGKNDGSVGGARYFTCPDKSGVFVKPEKVQIGDFPPLDLDDELMEEI